MKHLPVNMTEADPLSTTSPSRAGESVGYEALNAGSTISDNPTQGNSGLPSQPKLELVELVEVGFRQSRTGYRFYPAFPLVYMGHVWFRRRLPRVLPRLTSMRLWEIYTSAGFYALLETERRRIQTHWVDDRDLGMIQIGAYFLWQHNHHSLATIQGMTFREGIPSRTDFYPRWEDGILAELVWWHNHMWSTDQTWKGVSDVLMNATNTLTERGWSPPSRDDWDRACTYFANAIHSSDGGKNNNLAWPFVRAFATVTPFAMLARWLSWRKPILLMNAIQRCLFYGGAYLWPMHSFHFYWYSKTIEDKRKVAEILCQIYPGLDNTVDQIIQENRSWILEATYKQ